MNSPDVAPTPIRSAIALSIVIHVCALWLLAIYFGSRPDGGIGTLDQNTIVRVTRIDRRIEPAPSQMSEAKPVVISRPPAVRTTSVAVVSGPAAKARRTPHPATHAATRFAARPPARPFAPKFASTNQNRFVAPRALGLPHMPLAVVTPVPAATPSAAPSVAPPTPPPSPSPSPSPSPIAATPAPVVAANFSGLFSQNYPPALAAPAELSAIRARLSASVHIRVDVDETGRATEVRFIKPVADETLAQKIRSELLALRYVPADCNGLHCDGTLEITY